MGYTCKKFNIFNNCRTHRQVRFVTGSAGQEFDKANSLDKIDTKAAHKVLVSKMEFFLVFLVTNK